MKKIFFCIVASFSGISLLAQNNTFPVSGNTGIGTTSPVTKLEVVDQAAYPAITLSARKNLITRSIISNFVNGNTEGLFIFHQGSDGTSYGAPTNSIILAADYTAGGSYRPLVLATNNISRMTIGVNGNIGIGTAAPGPYKLAVEGTIGARQVKVTLANPWADFVFENDYHLLPLRELEQFIQENKHLPDVPSAKEVAANGLDLGGNQAVLLRKIEELTLYVIEQDKVAEQLKKESELHKIDMMKKLEIQENEINELKRILKRDK